MGVELSSDGTYAFITPTGGKTQTLLNIFPSCDPSDNQRIPFMILRYPKPVYNTEALYASSDDKPLSFLDVISDLFKPYGHFWLSVVPKPNPEECRWVRGSARSRSTLQDDGICVKQYELTGCPINQTFNYFFNAIADPWNISTSKDVTTSTSYDVYK